MRYLQYSNRSKDDNDQGGSLQGTNTATTTAKTQSHPTEEEQETAAKEQDDATATTATTNTKRNDTEEEAAKRVVEEETVTQKQKKHQTEAEKRTPDCLDRSEQDRSWLQMHSASDACTATARDLAFLGCHPPLDLAGRSGWAGSLRF